jgi:hypothetical protein
VLQYPSSTLYGIIGSLQVHAVRPVPPRQGCSPKSTSAIGQTSTEGVCPTLCKPSVPSTFFSRQGSLKPYMRTPATSLTLRSLAIQFSKEINVASLSLPRSTWQHTPVYNLNTHLQTLRRCHYIPKTFLGCISVGALAPCVLSTQHH